MTLQTEEIEQLREAIEDLYYFEFVLGNVTVEQLLSRTHDS